MMPLGSFQHYLQRVWWCTSVIDKKTQSARPASVTQTSSRLVWNARPHTLFSRVEMRLSSRGLGLLNARHPNSIPNTYKKKSVRPVIF